MKYMLLIYMDENAMDDQERGDCYVESTRLCQELSDAGKFLGANPLQPVATATSVQVRAGRSVVTDGPFAETHEQLGGYFLIDVENIDEAIAVANRIPAAKKGAVEVRPVVELPGLPPGQ